MTEFGVDYLTGGWRSVERRAATGRGGMNGSSSSASDTTRVGAFELRVRHYAHYAEHGRMVTGPDGEDRRCTTNCGLKLPPE